MCKHFKNGVYSNIMLEKKFILTLMVNLSMLIAVNEYLRKRGDERVCSVLDSVVEGVQSVLDYSKRK